MLERDLSLVRRWQTGDAAAGVELLDHYVSMVRMAARRCGVRDTRDFLELWQELAVRVLQDLPNLHARVHTSFAGFLSWQVRDLARRCRRREPVFAATEVDVATDACPAATAEVAELARAVHECKQALPAGEQRVFTLRFEQGLSLAEVAASTGSNANAVAQSVFRLVRRMRAGLEARGLAPEGLR